MTSKMVGNARGESGFTLIDLLFRRISHQIYKRPPAGTIDNT